MLSMPPATTTSAEPARKRSCATMAAFMPEPHILLMVVAPAASGSPAPIAACRAGAWPWPAGSTQPIRISSTLSTAIPARSTAAAMARAPSAGALTSFKSPRNPPMGVRAAPTITTGSEVVIRSASAGVGTACPSSIIPELAREASSHHIGDEQAIGNAGMDQEFRGIAERRAAIVSLTQQETGIDETMIEPLIRAFYARVRQDPLLAPIFESRVADWEPQRD